MKKKLSNIKFTNRDIDLLRFIWFVKLATTGTLWAKIFQPSSPWMAYKRLLKLKKSGFITHESTLGRDLSYWSLTNKGFQSIRQHLPSLDEIGYKSENIAHDILVSAVQLGDTVFSNHPHLQVITEQALRRCHSHCFTSIIPHRDKHRPDGYWILTENKKDSLVALEVERSQKKSDRYVKVALFYNDYSQIKNVLWGVNKTAEAHKILNILEEYSDKNNKHNFFLIEDFKRSAWSSEIFLGPNKAKTIRQLLLHNVGNNDGTRLEHVPSPLLLDSRISHRHLSEFHKAKNMGFPD